MQPPVETQRSLELWGGPSSFDDGKQVLMEGLWEGLCLNWKFSLIMHVLNFNV